MTVDDGMRPLFRKHIPHFHWQSIETGGTGQGIPDSNFCAPPLTPLGPGFEGWIEYKATEHWSVDLLPEQIGWLMRRARTGGRVWIAVRRRHDGGPRLGPPVDELYVFPGALAKVAKAGGGLRAPDVQRATRRWQGGPLRWDWRAVAALLRTRPVVAVASVGEP